MPISKHRFVATRVYLVVAVIALSTATQAFARDVLSDKKAIEAILDQNYGHLDSLYKDIHSHPEVQYQEIKTATKLAAEMRSLGFTVTEGVGKTGIVAIYRNGPGPTIMVRTELDALPMEEKTGLPYSSHATTLWNGKETGVAHSCGHDIHMTAWVGAAKALVTMRDTWKGTLMFVGQPAEEGGGGAKSMLDDGLFSRFGKPDYGFALHTTAFAYGEVRYHRGAITSTTDGLAITFKGHGGQASNQSEGVVDPLLQAANFTIAVQGLTAREKNPFKFGTIGIGSIQGGTVGNVIPDTARVLGTVRTYDPEVRDKLLAGIQRTAAATANLLGAPPPDVTVTPYASSVVNDDSLMDRALPIWKTAFGDELKETERFAAGDDFYEYIKAGVPSIYFIIGIYPPKRAAEAAAGGPRLEPNHSPAYAPVPEPTIRTGVTAMTLVVLDRLGQ
jgi:hippurate hydrolase